MPGSFIIQRDPALAGEKVLELCLDQGRNLSEPPA